jgi:hypothetical protein
VMTLQEEKNGQAAVQGHASCNNGSEGGKPPNKEAIDHFEKLLEAPCPNHHYPVWHAYKDCRLLKKFLSKEAPSGKGPEPHRSEKQERKGPIFPDKTECFMIFEGSDYHASKRHWKLERREVF